MSVVAQCTNVLSNCGNGCAADDAPAFKERFGIDIHTIHTIFNMTEISSLIVSEANLASIRDPTIRGIAKRPERGRSAKRRADLVSGRLYSCSTAHRPTRHRGRVAPTDDYTSCIVASKLMVFWY